MMAITVRQLLAQQALQLSLCAGEAGLEREVLWAHASDLPEPWQYLARSEALLTNGTGMTAEPVAQARFVLRLEQGGSSALGYGLDTGPSLTDAAIDAANRVGLPLFTLPRQAKFSGVAQFVAAANANQEHRELQTVGRVYEILHNALAAHADTADVLPELEEEVGAQLSLVNLVDGSPALGSPDRGYGRDVISAVSAPDTVLTDLIRLTPAGKRLRDPALMVPLDWDIPVALVISAPESSLPSRALLQHLATAVTIELARSRPSTKGGHEPRSLFANIAAGGARSHSANALLRKQGFEVANCIVVAARRLDNSAGRHLPYLPEGGWGNLRHVTASEDHECHVLVDLGVEGELLNPVGVSGWVVGTSLRLGHVDRAYAAIREAEWAASIACVEAQSVGRYGDPDHWMHPANLDQADYIVRRTIGSIVDLDLRRSSDYVNTLHEWLIHDRSWSRTAEVLGIHKQTLGYRLRKIQELVGLDMNRTDHLAWLWRGVRARELVREANQWSDSLIS